MRQRSTQPQTQPQCEPQRKTYYEFTIAADEEFMQMYRRVRSLQSIKAAPGQDIAATFKALMREHIARHAPEEKQKRRQQRREARARQESVCEMQEQSYGSTHRPARETPDREMLECEAPGRKTLEPETPDREMPDHSMPKRDAPTLKRGEERRPRSRTIPVATRESVLVRDQYQCTYIGIDGIGCRATQNLQFDHVTPFARGGKSTVENLRLLCSAHNRLEARGMFGRAVPTVIREPAQRYDSYRTRTALGGGRC